MDKANFLESLIELLAGHHVRYCVIGGQAVNAYAEPVVTLDLDLVVAVDQLEQVESLLAARFRVQRFPHSLNVTAADSDLRVQIQTDPAYAEFPQRAAPREILGVMLPVASIEDVFQGKVWAVMAKDRRSSKRQKDLADIARLIEQQPGLRERLPLEIRQRLLA